MHPTVRLAAAATPRVHKPLIHFVGKRVWPSTPEPQHPHPAAPAEFKEHFSSFLTKFKASAMRDPQPVAPSAAAPKNAAKENVQVINDFTQLPARLRSPDLTEAEIEAITSGGASLY